MKELRRPGSVRTLALASASLVACGSPPVAECPAPPASKLIIPAASTAPAPSATLAASAAANTATPSAAPAAVLVEVANATSVARAKETIALSETELKKVAPTLELGKALVFDAQGAPVSSQVIAGVDGAPGELVFQTDLAPSGQQRFSIAPGERKPAPAGEYRVYGRFVRERHDDFAWENDLVAHRMYGPDLETTKKEPLISSGIDLWAKRVPRLLVNEWYLTDDYHQDHGDGADFYAVGKTRGCGGLGIWAKEKLAVSKNFVTSRVLANGPIRLVFELDYAPWDAGGVKVSETKRVTLDAGTFFNRFESTFTAKKGPLAVALGIAKHPGGTVQSDSSSLRVWEPVDNGKNGNLACAIVLAPGGAGIAQQGEDGFLLVTAAKPAEPLRYYVGSAWDRAGKIATFADWSAEVQKLTARNAAPPRVTLSAAPSFPSAPVSPPAPAPSPHP
jgi:hypothetical protein